LNSLRKIIETAAVSGQSVTFIAKNGRSHRRRSWDSLLQAARRRAGIYSHDEVMPGDRVILMGDTGPALVEALIAVNLRGAIPTILAPPRPSARAHYDFILKVFHDLNAKRVFLTESYYEHNQDLIAKLCGRARRLTDSEDNLIKCADAPESSMAFLQFSSGSTRTPRGVKISQTSLTNNLDSIKAGAESREGDVVVSWLPLYHDMGLIAGLFGPPAWSMQSVMMDPMTFIRRPSRWLKAISDFDGTISMAPNFAYQYCLRFIKPKEMETVDLSSWRLSWNGAEMVLASTIHEFEKHFKAWGLSENLIVPSYGAAEATLKISSRAPQQALLTLSLARDSLAHGVARIARGDQEALRVVSVGRPTGDMNVRIVDDEQSTLPDWQVGQIEISGPSVSQGYFGIDDENFTGGGRFLTGDLGFTMSGELFVTGRMKDLILIDGRNLYPFDLEWTAKEILGNSCRQVAAFGAVDAVSGSERIVVAVEATPRNKPNLALYRKLELGLVSSAATTKVEIIHVDRIPTTSSGKVQRAKMKELYASGLFEVPWTEEVA
jgi:fatty-acyl-CoA synthase